MINCGISLLVGFRVFVLFLSCISYLSRMADQFPVKFFTCSNPSSSDLMLLLLLMTMMMMTSTCSVGVDAMNGCTANVGIVDEVFFGVEVDRDEGGRRTGDGRDRFGWRQTRRTGFKAHSANGLTTREQKILADL